MKTRCSWKGTYLSKDKKYSVEFKSFGYEYYRPATYFDPEEYEVECEEVEIKSVTDAEGNKITLTDNLKTMLENEIMDACEDGQHEPEFQEKGED